MHLASMKNRACMLHLAAEIVVPSWIGDHGKTQPGICQPLRQAVYELNTTSIKVLFMAAFWSKWAGHISPNIEYTVKLYADIGVRLLIVQEPAMQPQLPKQIYKNLLDRGELTDANLRV